jgi:hypothetical protein
MDASVPIKAIVRKHRSRIAHVAANTRSSVGLCGCSSNARLSKSRADHGSLNRATIVAVFGAKISS